MQLEFSNLKTLICYHWNIKHISIASYFCKAIVIYKHTWLALPQRLHERSACTGLNSLESFQKRELANIARQHICKLHSCSFTQQPQFVMKCCQPFFFNNLNLKWNVAIPFVFAFFQQPQFVIMKCCDPFCICFSTTTTKYVFTLYLSRGMYYRVFDESWKKEDLKVFILGLAFLWGTLSMSKLCPNIHVMFNPFFPEILYVAHVPQLKQI